MVGYNLEINNKIDYILIKEDDISRDFILKNQKESLLILAILLKDITVRGNLSFNLNNLFYSLNIPLNKGDRKIKIINSINKMFKGSIPSNTSINKKIYIPYTIDMSNIISVQDESVDNILNYRDRVDKFDLFNTYLMIRKHLKHNSDLVGLTVKDLLYHTDIVSNNTMLKYLSILNEIELIGYKSGKPKLTLNKPNKHLKPKIYSEGEDFTGLHGVYFIYDKEEKIAYIGKSIACVVKRSIESMMERGLCNFTKIEIKPTQAQSDVEIYEKYYIQKYKPYCNKEGVFEDSSNIILPEIKTRQILRNINA